MKPCDSTRSPRVISLLAKALYAAQTQQLQLNYPWQAVTALPGYLTVSLMLICVPIDLLTKGQVRLYISATQSSITHINPFAAAAAAKDISCSLAWHMPHYKRHTVVVNQRPFKIIRNGGVKM